jgi:alkylresorcinol/alkylpyrone synthase
VLLLCVELCSITFQWDDLSKRNLIATAIFSDGAAAVLVEGDKVKQPQDNLARPYQAKVLGTQSTLWHDTLPIMGWDIKDTGFEVVFSSRIPHLVQDLIHDTITEFLDQYNIALSQISRFIFHPGGTKVIRAYERVLKGGKDGFEHAHEVLRKHGNMSSPSVFFVYESALRDNPLEPGEYALMVVLGPGFSCEMALIQG